MCRECSRKLCSGFKSLLCGKAALWIHIAYLTCLSLSILVHDIRCSFEGTLTSLMLFKRFDSRTHCILGILINWVFKLPLSFLLAGTVNHPDPALSEGCGAVQPTCHMSFIMYFLVLKGEVLLGWWASMRAK